jgi:signal transduction histidine kinase
MNRSIEIKLFEELKVRNSRLLWPHLGVVAVTAWVLRDMNVFYPYLILICALVLRIQVLKNQSRVSLVYLMGCSVTGLSWGVVFSHVYQTYGLSSVQSMSILGLIIILMSGGVTAFSASLKTSYVYFVSLAIVPAYFLFTDKGELTYILGLLLCANLIYHFYHTNVSHKLMRQLLEAEHKAISQKKTLQEFINAIPGLVAVIDLNEKFIMVNNNFDGLFRGVIGKALGGFYPDSELTGCLLSFLRSSSQEDIREIRTSIEGIDSWYMVHLRRITSPETGIVAAIQPITEFVKAKNDLRIQEARSQYTARLVSLGEFSAGIAHEVNNPLTIIEGSVSLMKILLEDQDIDRKALHKSADKISETASRIAKIIKSLRTLSGNAQEEPFTNVSFESIVDPALEISKPKLLSHNIKLTIHAPSEKVDLFGNEVQLSQVMMNLVSNAIDAVKDSPDEKWIQIHYNALVEWLDIMVIDSGSGVQENIRARIMDPFFTTKVAHKGTGLGLSISKSIIENHQGSLTLISEASHTTFRMRFPRMNTWIKKTEVVGEIDVVQG